MNILSSVNKITGSYTNTKYAIGGLIALAAAWWVSRNGFTLPNFSFIANTQMAGKPTMMPVVSRGFPDQSIKYNVVPSPYVEALVPFDSSGLYSRVTGAYDRCDALIFP